MGAAVRRSRMGAYGVAWPRRLSGYGVRWPRTLGQSDPTAADLQASATPGDYVGPGDPTFIGPTLPPGVVGYDAKGNPVYDPNYNAAAYMALWGGAGPSNTSPSATFPASILASPANPAVPSGMVMNAAGQIVPVSPSLIDQASAWLSKSTVITGTSNVTVLFGGLAAVVLLPALFGGKRRR